MVREKRLLEELAASITWLQLGTWSEDDDGAINVRFTVELHIAAFNGVLTYPQQFPDVPAYIRPQARHERWSEHQFVSGALCLEWGSDNWEPTVTGAELVKSAWTLLLTEKFREVFPAAPAVPSRHVVTSAQKALASKSRFVITREGRDLLRRVPPGAAVSVKTSTTYNGDASVTVLSTIERSAVPDVPSDQVYERDGWVVPVESVSSITASSVDELRLALGDLVPWPTPLTDAFLTVLLADQYAGIRVFVMGGADAPLFWECHVVEFDDGAGTRLPAATLGLSKKKVVVVGLGSVGSKVAVSLARTGLGKLLLFDDDIFSPSNLVRNDLDWRAVGFAKVRGVKRAVNDVSPQTEVLAVQLGVADQGSPQSAELFYSLVEPCDLIVDATANPHAFVALAAMARRLRKPMVWGELFAGGTAALLARSRPGADAEPLAIRTHVLGVLNSYPPVPEGKSARYGLDTGSGVLVATDADVSSLAAAMTQFALDTLADASQSEYPSAAYLIGYKKYWIFEQPMEVIPIDCSTAQRAVVEEGPLTAEDTTALSELEAALKETADAVRDTPT
jgi:molybdopterin/thiamine biosynthesis adenylyltransferase